MEFVQIIPKNLLKCLFCMLALYLSTKKLQCTLVVVSLDQTISLTQDYWFLCNKVSGFITAKYQAKF